ncbi:MAG: hypothetical protein EP343_04640 [Deltaproteobacteria bacterium]|nr:MAG: hypothetical protein EP343_04640 [Deltaproteobacteria bacterium]
MKFRLFVLVLPFVALMTVNCGSGLSAACQKAKDCCEAAKVALGTTGDEVVVECNGSKTTVTCSGIGTGGDLGELACNLVNSTLGESLKTCGNEVAACN